MKIGLSLSGGGAKGAAHIGVLQALLEENINIDYISRTSSGSIVASLYAIGYTPNEILNLFNTYCKYIADYDKMLPFKVVGTMFTGKINIKCVAKGNNLENLIYTYAMKKNIFDISSIDKYLAIPCVDLKTGKVVYFLNKNLNKILNNNEDSVYFYTGSISKIVRASCSLPVVFEPITFKDYILVDGGIRVNTPVDILKKMGADKVIAVYFDENNKCRVENNIISVAMKSFDIMSDYINMQSIRLADINIVPKTFKTSFLDCSKTNLLAKQGYIATKNAIKNIKNLC